MSVDGILVPHRWNYEVNCNVGFICTLVSTDIFVRVSGGETPPFRPPIPPDDTTNDVQLIELMRDCWDEQATLRPDFSTIHNRFVAINKGKYDMIHDIVYQAAVR